MEAKAALLRASGDGLCGEGVNWPGLGWEVCRTEQGLWYDHTSSRPWRSAFSGRQELRRAESANCKLGAGGRRVSLENRLSFVPFF